MEKYTALMIRTLKQKNLSLALAESMTCGLASHGLCGVMGTTDVLRGTIICYAPKVKKEMFGITQKLIDKNTCESQVVTDLLAKRLKKIIEADVHAAVTGLASPGGSETKNKPVGTVFISVHYKNKLFQLKKRFKGTPLQIRKKTCIQLYRFVTEVVANY
jgi:nicotinamide-nucleotide amidase